MERFIHNENLLLFRKKLTDPQTTDTERKVIQKLLAEEEARELPPKKAEDGLRSRHKAAVMWRRPDAGFLQRVIGNGARVDAAFLDPPYNVRIGGHAVSTGSHREFAMASGEMSEAEFRSFLADTLGAAARCSCVGRVHFVCMDWRHMDSVSAVASTVYGEWLNLCIWNKSNAGMGSLYRSKHELVFVYRVGRPPTSTWSNSAGMAATARMSGNTDQRSVEHRGSTGQK